MICARSVSRLIPEGLQRIWRPEKFDKYMIRRIGNGTKDGRPDPFIRSVAFWQYRLSTGTTRKSLVSPNVNAS